MSGGMSVLPVGWERIQMPVVSVNLTDNAWKCYKMWRDHGRSASKKVSQAICRLWEQEDVVPSLQPGDRRTSVSGDEIEWTTEGWKLSDDPVEEGNQSNIEWMKQQEMKE